MSRTGFSVKAAVFIALILVVAYASIAFGERVGYFRDVLLLKGNLLDAALLYGFIFGVGFILRWLLKWFYRAEAGFPRWR